MTAAEALAALVLPWIMVHGDNHDALVQYLIEMSEDLWNSPADLDALSLSDEVAVLAGDWARWLAAHVAGRTYRAIILTPTEIDSLDRAGLLRDGSRRSPEPIPCALINGARFSTFPTPPVEEWAELVSPRS